MIYFKGFETIDQYTTGNCVYVLISSSVYGQSWCKLIQELRYDNQLILKINEDCAMYMPFQKGDIVIVDNKLDKSSLQTALSPYL